MGIEIDFEGERELTAAVRSELQPFQESCSNVHAALERCASAFQGDASGIVRELLRLRGGHASSTAMARNRVAELAATLDRATDLFRTFEESAAEQVANLDKQEHIVWATRAGLKE